MGTVGSVKFVISIVRDSSEGFYFSVARRLESRGERVETQPEKSHIGSTSSWMRKATLLHVRHKLRFAFCIATIIQVNNWCVSSKGIGTGNGAVLIASVVFVGVNKALLSVLSVYSVERSQRTVKV